jgi:hypothetical protein
MGARRVAPGVWRLGTDFINYYALEEDGRLTVVDAGAPKVGATLEAELRATGFSLGTSTRSCSPTQPPTTPGWCRSCRKRARAS